LKAVVTTLRPYRGHVVETTVRYTRKNLHSAFTARRVLRMSVWIQRPSIDGEAIGWQGSGRTHKGSGHGIAARQADETELEESPRALRPSLRGCGATDGSGGGSPAPQASTPGLLHRVEGHCEGDPLLLQPAVTRVPRVHDSLVHRAFVLG
jgi:hypothetical protein